MLIGNTLTSMRTFIQHTHEITDLNEWVFVYYIIEYDGSNECKQDISRLIGGFPYGDLTIVNTALMHQYLSAKSHPHLANTHIGCPARPLEECIEHIEILDWVCLSAGKLFIIPAEEIDKTIEVWKLKEIPYDVAMFKKHYPSYGVEGGAIYEKSYN